MNILIVAEGRYPDFVGGAETVIRHLGREFAAREHRVYTLTRKPRHDAPHHEIVDGVHVYRYPGPPTGSLLHWLDPFFSFWGARSLSLLLSHEVRIDAIIFNHAFPALGVLSSGRCADIRKVYVFHSASHLELRAAVPRDGTLWDASLILPMVCVRRSERYALRNCDVLVTLSQYMRNRAICFHAEAAKRIAVIPGGVDTELFSPVPGLEEKKHLRQKLDVSPDGFVLFAAKRLYRGMGLEKLVDAVGLLVDKHVYLLLAGDGPLRTKLERIICYKGLEDRIRLLGNVPHPQMPSYYRLADLFVSTRPEPFGLATLEALACGLPVLSVPAGGGPEILQRLSENLLFEDSTPTSMASLILRYIDHPERLESLAQRGRQYVEKNYSWAAFGSGMEQLLSRQREAVHR